MHGMVCTKPSVHSMSEQSTQAKRRRREHSSALKRELIERRLRPRASVSGLALEGGINAASMNCCPGTSGGRLLVKSGKSNPWPPESHQGQARSPRGLRRELARH